MDIQKNIKKNKKPIFTITIIILIIFSVILYLGLKIGFTINDELTITLQPLDASFTTDRDSVSVKFEVQTNNFFFCDSICEYNLLDVSTGTIIDSGTISLESNDGFSEVYSFAPEEQGSGQKIYVFKSVCSNIRKGVCRTEEDKRLETSIVTLNYGLSDREQKIKSASQTRLEKILLEISETDSILRTNAIQITEIGNPTELFSANQKQSKRLEELKNGAEQLISIWKSEDYFLLDRLSKTFAEVDTQGAHQISMDIQLFVKETNEKTGVLEFLFNRTKQITNILAFYRIADNKKFNQALDMALELNTYFKTSADLDSLTNISQRFEQINRQYVTDREEFYVNMYLDIIVSNIMANKSYDIEALYSPVNISQACLDISGAVINASNDDAIKIIRENLDRDNARYGLIRDLLRDDRTLPPEDRICSAKYDFRFNNVDAELFTMSNKTIVSNFNTSISQNPPICCINNHCNACCGDCSNENYPILFIHGHSANERNSVQSSLAAFAKIQENLQKEGIVNAGQINLDSGLVVNQGEWGLINAPVSVRASYYLISFYDIGAYIVTTQKTESIESYSLRLREIITLIKEKTGKDKVVVVAHSMGGLVAREYLSIFGEDDVDKLILISTPNNGIKGSVKTFCGILGSDKECRDLAQESVFIKRISRSQPKIDVYSIYGTGCDTSDEAGDGIVTAASARLDYATNIEIKGECTDLLGTDLHTNIIDPDKYPQTYQVLSSLLLS